MTRLIALLLILSRAAAAEPIDLEAMRLQSAEAAVRAGRNSIPPVIINNRKAQTPGKAQAQSEGRPLAMPNAPREFPVPPRMEAQPSPSGVQALVTAHMARPVETPKVDTGDAEVTAAGRDAIAAFRRNHGVAP